LENTAKFGRKYSIMGVRQSPQTELGKKPVVHLVTKARDDLELKYSRRGCNLSLREPLPLWSTYRALPWYPRTGSASNLIIARYRLLKKNKLLSPGTFFWPWACSVVYDLALE
jgi:hypothetical protein